MALNEDLVNSVTETQEDEVEAKIRYHLGAIGEVWQNRVLHTRVEIPDFNGDADQESSWWIEERRRCIKGHNGMTGKHYFYFHHCTIKHSNGARTFPEYRRADADFYARIESHLRGENKGWGLLGLKRRRMGASWKAAADVLHECTFYWDSDIGVQSKSEDDVKIFLNEKLKFIYDNVPPAFRAKTHKNSLMKMRFGESTKDKQGNKINIGNTSVITCKAPTDTAWEGTGMKYWLVDEAGKTPNLGTILSMTKPCLTGADGITIESFAFLFGTAGDEDDIGDDYKELWYNAEAEGFKQYFMPGWVGLFLDQYGNEDIPRAVRYIIEEREKKKQLSEKKYLDYIQQYPLTPEEAFISSGGSRFNSLLIDSRIADLDKNPPVIKEGYLDWLNPDRDDSVGFYPSANPSDKYIEVLEHPIANAPSNLYIAGADPYDHKKLKETNGSGGCMWIMKRSYITQADEEGHEEQTLMQMPVAVIKEGGTDPESFYLQCLLACIYFDCKVLVERNRIGMITFFDNHGYTKYLKAKPFKVNSLKQSTSSFYDLGVHMDADTKNHMLDLMINFVNENIGSIYFVMLLTLMKSYDPDNQRKKHDEVDAFGIMLLHATDKGLVKITPKKNGQKVKKMGLRKIGGVLRRT